jgi:hypothetical protein
MRSVVGDRGFFLIYENASPDGEDRDDWLRRWDDQKPWWTALAPEEWDAGRPMCTPTIFPSRLLGGMRWATKPALAKCASCS